MLPNHQDLTSRGGAGNCYSCTGQGDDSLCAIGQKDDWIECDCGNADFDIEFCFVSRDRGVWERGCCEGRDKCKDVHDNFDDGATKDIVHCHSDYCNNQNPRDADATQVSHCYTCNGMADDSPCALGDPKHPDVKETNCSHIDHDNTYCTVSRERGA